MNQGHTRPQETRRPKHEVLPDGRMRITRFYSIAKGAKLVDGLILAWGTADVAPATGGTSTWATCRLTNQFIQDGDDDNTLVRVYEELPATDEQVVGNPTKVITEDGRTAWEYTYLQFTAGTYTPQTVGTSTASGNGTLRLINEEATDDGTLRTIKRRYIGAGTLSTTDRERNNQKLKIRTVVSAYTVPSTPSGYTLIDTEVRNPNGYPTYIYTFAQGDGEISRSTSYRQSDDAGTTGATIITIRHLTPSATGSDPTSSPGAGYGKIDEDKSDQDGYRVWTIVYAKGTGLVVDSVQTRSMGGLKVYRRVSLGAAPTTPDATIGGSLELFDTEVRNADGYKVYDYRWSEAAGTSPSNRAGIRVVARDDGSLVYNVTEYGAASATPTYPGSGTGYLTGTDNNRSDGHWLNQATYIKAPATVTLKKMRQVRMPGEAEFETGTGLHNLLLTSESNRLLKCDVEISYSTSQLTDTPWKVDYGTTLRVSYKRKNQTVYEYEQKVMPFFLASSDTVTGTSGEFYNGVECEAYSATLTASSPTALPTGATVLDIDHDVYLTAIDGTVVYRRIKVSYTF